MTESLAYLIIALAAGAAGGFFAAWFLLRRDTEQAARVAADEAGRKTVQAIHEELARLAEAQAALLNRRGRRGDLTRSQLPPPVGPEDQRRHAARERAQREDADEEE